MRWTRIASILGLGLALGSPFALGGRDALLGLRGVAPPLFLLLIALAAISGVAKAGKLQMLLVGLGQRPNFPRTLAISLATDFAFLSSPAGAAGYAVNIALLRGADTSWVVATAAVGAEQALDLLFFALALPIAACSGFSLLARVVPRLPGSSYSELLSVVLAIAAGLWLWRRRLTVAARSLIAALPWLQRRRARYAEFLSALLAQLGELLKGDTRRHLGLLLLTTLQWLARYGVIWMVLRALGHRLPFGFVLVLQAGIIHLTQWTGIPAGGGSADLALASALGPWVPRPTMATVLLLWRFATLYCPLLAGALSLAMLPGKRPAY